MRAYVSKYNCHTLALCAIYHCVALRLQYKFYKIIPWIPFIAYASVSLCDRSFVFNNSLGFFFSLSLSLFLSVCSSHSFSFFQSFCLAVSLSHLIVDACFSSVNFFQIQLNDTNVKRHKKCYTFFCCFIIIFILPLYGLHVFLYSRLFHINNSISNHDMF